MNQKKVVPLQGILENTGISKINKINNFIH